MAEILTDADKLWCRNTALAISNFPDEVESTLQLVFLKGQLAQARKSVATANAHGFVGPSRDRKVGEVAFAVGADLMKCVVELARAITKLEEPNRAMSNDHACMDINLQGLAHGDSDPDRDDV